MTASLGDLERQEKRKEIDRLAAEIRRLEAELEPRAQATWPPPGYYTTFHVLVGMLLGFVGSSSSLLFNIVGSLLVGQHPLQLIRVYLTFPLGEAALTLDSGIVLGVGTCLYLVTGVFYGIAFHLVMSRWFDRATPGVRLLVATGVGLGLWLINFYGILIWLQPLMFGGSWIVTLVPFWVAAGTHLVFAWTMLVIEQWGVFVPYTPRS
jgi:hypothetical protein